MEISIATIMSAINDYADLSVEKALEKRPSYIEFLEEKIDCKHDTIMQLIKILQQDAIIDTLKKTLKELKV